MRAHLHRILAPAIVLLSVASATVAPVHADDTSFSTLQRGRQLVDAGDCVACHTAGNGGQPFAGGRPIETPFGVIYSPNLTPDPETGIGAWTDDDFYRAMHTGVGPDGTRFYPAFPYPYFTKLTRADVLAMRAYLNTLPPVHSDRPEAELIWPLNHRLLMAGWNALFFDPGAVRPDPAKSDEWNRGAYLVQGAGHCGACHTPKNLVGADKTADALHGGIIQNWFAPEIANNRRSGIGSWSADDLVAYLKTGRNRHSAATGLMAEVVTNSTSKLPDSDLHAIATYLLDSDGSPTRSIDPPRQTLMTAGEAIFTDSCAGCHKTDGAGVPLMFPPLAGNANVQSRNPTTVLRVILEGARTVATDARPTAATMPAYRWKLDDAAVAAVASYVRNAWGNQAPAVSAGQVEELRDRLRAKVR